MGRREIACEVEQTSTGVPPRVGSCIAALALVLGVIMAPAATFATTLTVTGGPGLDQGELCTTGFLCPGTPVFSLIGAAPVTGSFTYNSGPQTVDFLLTLTAPANFGGALMLAGSTFSANAVPVISLPFGSGILLTQIGAATGLAGPVAFSPALPVIAGTPSVSGLSCSIGTGSDQCGVSLGSGGLQFGTFDAFLTFNTNVVVPVPAAVWLFLTARLAPLMTKNPAAAGFLRCKLWKSSPSGSSTCASPAPGPM